MTPWLGTGDGLLELGVFAVALALDIMLPEPPMAVHPVAWMGRLISACERMAMPWGRRRQLAFGVAMAVLVPLVFAAVAALALVGLREIGWLAYLFLGGLLLRTSFTVKGLGKATLAVADALDADDVLVARQRVQGLVSRDTAELQEGQVASAAVETVSENVTDGYLGPWLAFAVLGLPGAWAYRAVNTLDSMVGYRGRYEWLGKASAKLDDAVNFIPARVGALLSIAAGGLLGYGAARGWRVMWQDRRRPASPNAGWTMAATAGLLRVELEKPGHYVLGAGFGRPGPADIRRAVQLCYAIAVLGALLAGGLILLRGAMI